MIGCFRRIGCLVVLLIVAAVLWFTRGRWERRLFGERAPATAQWTPVSDSGSAEATAAIRSLAASQGPAFVNLTAGQLGALLLARAGDRLPASLRDAQLSIVGDRVLLRGSVQLDDIKGLDAFGSLGNLTDRRETIEVGGTLDVVRPGLAEFVVRSAQLGELPLPQAAIPKVMNRLWKGERPAGVSPSALPVPLPKSIGDVRVARGRITLYRATP